MASIFSFFARWFGRGGALGDTHGVQIGVPGVPLVDGAADLGPDSALQLATVWACIDRRATTVASLPFMAYQRKAGGQKDVARTSRLWTLLHDSPNSRMTPFDFWRTLMLNHDLRGNGYARIDRDQRSGEAIALWPMPADQVVPVVLDDGSMVYQYTLGANVALLAEDSVLHLRNLGNGTLGLDKLAFMRGSTNEAARAQNSAAALWGSSGKPSGVLMLDHVLTPEQRKRLLDRFAGMASGNTARLFLLEANMKYQQLTISPEQQQLLESRQFSVEEICRWYDVPPVLAHHSNVTTWGSGIEQIVNGFYKLTVRPLLVSIEQAVRKRVMTAQQRTTMSVEFSLDALLRGSAQERAAYYSTALQNGYMTRNEVRQLENLPPDPSAQANALTAQTNLVPLDDLGAAALPQPQAQAAPAQLHALLREIADKVQTANDAERRHRELLAALTPPREITSGGS